MHAFIEINKLKIKTILGVYEQERKIPQDVIVNLKIEFDASKAIKSDNIKDALDYAALTQKIKEKAEKSSFYLIEKLAAKILELIMQDKRVCLANVTVTKPNALDNAESVSCTISSD